MKRVRLLLVPLGLVLGLCATPSKAGSAPAEIDCKALTGETLRGTIPADYVEVDLVFDDGKGTTQRWQTEDEVVFHDDLKEKLLLLHLPGTPSLKLWALPRSMKITRDADSANGRFEAVTGIEGDPAPRRLELACTYHYAI